MINSEKWLSHFNKDKNELVLDHLNIADQDISEICEFVNQFDVHFLSLKDNDIGDAGAELLAACNKLISLDLTDNCIKDEGAIALAANTTLTSLILEDNLIKNRGAIALAANTSLTSLNLEDNIIGHKGAIAFAGNSKLTSLNLSFNFTSDGEYIKNETAKAFFNNHTLTFLNLPSYDIDDQILQDLQKILNQNAECAKRKSLQLFANTTRLFAQVARQVEPPLSRDVAIDILLAVNYPSPYPNKDETRQMAYRFFASPMIESIIEPAQTSGSCLNTKMPS